MTRSNIITMVCVDCKKETTAPSIWFRGYKCMKNEGVYRCRSCSNIKLSHDPEWIRKNKEMVKLRSENPNWIRNVEEMVKHRSENPEWVKNNNEVIKKLHNDPEIIKKQRESVKKLPNDPKWIAKMQETRNNPEYKRKQMEGIQNYWNDPSTYELFMIKRSGQGFWYGHPIINKDVSNKVYCEIWEDVKPRIVAFNIDMHNGVLTCEICENPINGGSHQFIHHHVFYEKRTCCWNENGIYTTNLNIKSMPKDSYIIGENPNYFAITCTKCHGKTNGGYENRKKWADFFKNKIDTEYDGKSYYTKEEMIDRNDILNKK